MIKFGKSNTMYVVLGLLVVSTLLISCFFFTKEILDIAYLFVIDILFARYLYVKKKS